MLDYYMSEVLFCQQQKSVNTEISLTLPLPGASEVRVRTNDELLAMKSGTAAVGTVMIILTSLKKQAQI